MSIFNSVAIIQADKIFTYDKKEGGKFYNVCKECGHTCNSGSYHFPEDLIK